MTGNTSKSRRLGRLLGRRFGLFEPMAVIAIVGSFPLGVDGLRGGSSLGGLLSALLDAK